MPHRRIIATEIRENVTPLLRVLAGVYWQSVIVRGTPRELFDLCHAAHNLLLDFDDYETPARAAGWLPDPGDTLGRVYLPREMRDGEADAFYHAASWQEACGRMALPALALPVCECWSVSEWLADALDAHGQRTADLAGLHIWARTSTEPLERDETVKAIWRANDGDRPA